MKKASNAVALVLVFGLFAAAFSLAPAIAQYTPPSDTQHEQCRQYHLDSKYNEHHHECNRGRDILCQRFYR